jgi:hypothetical protein
LEEGDVFALLSNLSL